MLAPVIIELAGEPVAKQRPRFSARQGKDGRAFARAYTPAKTAVYEAQMKFVAALAMGGRALLNGALRMTVTSYRSIPASYPKGIKTAALAGEYFPTTKPDIDNVLKIAMDGLNGVVFHDDKQIVEAHVFKAYSDRPRLHIVVEAMALENEAAA